jgi:FkbM family methyltransferase
MEIVGRRLGIDAVRRLIPQAWKDAVAGVLCSTAVGDALRRFFRGKIPHRGHRILVDSQRVPPRTVAYIYFGLYERAEIDLVARFLPPDHDVVEFGASLGVNSCCIASKLMMGRRVVCVEADPDLARLASRTIALNGYVDRVTIVNAAVDYTGAARISLHRGDDTLSASIFGPKGTVGGKIDVDTLTLRKLLDDWAIGEYSLVTDIEGAELAVLVDDREALKRCRAIIIEIECCVYRGESYSRSRIRDMIVELGFVEAYAYGPCAAFLRDRSVATRSDF